MQDFLADPGPPVRGRQALASCRMSGCCYGRFGKGLCSKHSDRWARAGRPDLDRWEAPVLVASDAIPAECRLPFCTLWVDGPGKVFCQNHQERWLNAGRPDVTASSWTAS